MNAPGGSPFSGTRTRFRVWIALSLLLNLLVLAVWLLLPEPEPRKPGERKLTIRQEQAEELQERVEQANLEELREKVAELQSIKAAMAEIRGREMARLSAFEQTMTKEAPQDVAAMLMELAEIYESIAEDYERIAARLELYRKWYPQIMQASERDTVEGLRLLPNLEPYWAGFDGQADRFEVAFFETGARMEAIKVKLEWMTDQTIREAIASLELPMEKTFSLHREVWGAVPSSWKVERSFRSLTEDLDATIGMVQRFRREESEGRAAVTKERADLEDRISRTEAGLVRLNKDFQTAEAELAAIDRNKNREAWNAKREEVRNWDRSRRELEREMQNLNRTLARTNYQPDQQLARSVKTIEDRLRHSLPAPPDPALISRTMAQLREMAKRIHALAQSQEEAP